MMLDGTVAQAARLKTVRFDICGPVLRHARALEAAGRRVLNLNIQDAEG